MNFLARVEVIALTLATKSMDLLYQILTDKNWRDLPSDKRAIHGWFSKPKLLKNVWVIHMTDVPELIIKNGFRGTGLTRNLMQTRRKDAKAGAFVFGFPEKYKPTESDFETYGSSVVKFKAKEAIQVWHEGDGQIQIITDRKLISEITDVSAKYNKQYRKSEPYFKEFRGYQQPAVDYAIREAERLKTTLFLVKKSLDSSSWSSEFALLNEQSRLDEYTAQGFPVLKVDSEGNTRLAVKKKKPSKKKEST